MELSFNKDNDILTITVSGKIDSNNVHLLEEALKEKMVDINELIFDFTKVEYISSAGLRVLLASYKFMNGSMKILNANEMIKEIFTMTGMISIFNME